MPKVANIRYMLSEGMEKPLTRRAAPLDKEARDREKMDFRGGPQEYIRQRFYPHEVSGYLDMQLADVKWADIVTDDIEFMQQVAVNGFKIDDVTYKVIWFGWRDNRAKGVGVDISSTFKDLHDLDIYTDFDQATDCMKGFKYVNRLIVPLPIGVKIVTGSITDVKISADEHVVSFHVLLPNGKTIKMIYDDMKGEDYDEDGELKASVDGSMVFQRGAAEALGIPNYHVAGAGTFHTPFGLGKGHIVILDHEPHNMGMTVRVFGPKRMVKSAEKFYFLYMGELPVGWIPKTDPQAYCNFDMHRTQLGPMLARDFINKVIESSADEDKLKGMFLRYSPTANLEDGTLDLSAWGLREAMSYGLSYKRFPGLYRKVVRYLMTQILQCENARIPMEGVAAYASVLPDPYLFGNEELKPDLDYSNIDDGQVVVPSEVIEQDQEVLVYRQPSSNDSEHVTLKTIFQDRYQRYMGRDLCFVGRGAKKVLKRLQGADLDDTLVIVYDKIWRELIAQCSYPETEKLVVKESVSGTFGSSDLADELFLSQTVSLASHLSGPWNTRHGLYQLEVARQSRGGIGPAVNMEMIDKLLSSQRERIMKYLDTLDQNDPLVQDCKAWIEMRTPWQAAKIASNMELVIDGYVLDASKLSAFGDLPGMISKFHNGIAVDRMNNQYKITRDAGVLCYPQCMASKDVGGLMPIGKGRIPGNKQKRGDWVLVETEMCHSLKRIISLRDQAVEWFRNQEWDMVATPGYGGAPEVLDAYPYDDVIYQLTDQVRSIWREEWSNVFSNAVTLAPADNPYSIIQRRVEEFLDGLGAWTTKAIAVDLYRRFYGDPRLDKRGRERGYKQTIARSDAEGRTQSYPDALLWTHRLGHALITVMKEVGITGAYVGVNFDPKYRSYSKLQQLAVMVDKGVVYVPGKKKIKIAGVEGQASMERIGTVAKTPDGRYLIRYGILEIAQPSPDLQPVL